jgi:hypothetical protein
MEVMEKKIQKEVKERDKPIDPREMFGKKIKGVKNKSHYRKSMVDAKTSKKCKKNLMCSC